ncbi:MAG: hypothetical protein RIQ59_27 [Bacteroidota bacterium]
MIKDQILIQSGKAELGPKHYEKVKNIEDKLVRLQDLYIEGNIEKSEYKIAKERYDTIHQELKSNEVELKDTKRVVEIYDNALVKLESIEYQYNVSNIEDKRKIIGSMFPKKFQFENKKVRTADLNPLFLKISSINSLSQRTKKRTNSKKLNLSGMVGDEGFEPPTPSV